MNFRLSRTDLWMFTTDQCNYYNKFENKKYHIIDLFILKCEILQLMDQTFQASLDDDMNVQTPPKHNHIALPYKGIYNMHKYWSKKPADIVRKFILKYSDENEIVLDPFAGSGVSVSEAIILNRKAIGIDINPSAVFIALQTIKKIDVKKLEEQFRILTRQIKSKIDSFYQIIRGEQKYIGSHFIWKEDKLTEVWYKKKRF